MTITMSPTDSDFAPSDYTVDGSENTFASSFTIVSEGQAQVIQVTSTFGFIALESIDRTSGGDVLSMSASFTVNFEGGGAGSGTIVF